MVKVTAHALRSVRQAGHCSRYGVGFTGAQVLWTGSPVRRDWSLYWAVEQDFELLSPARKCHRTGSMANISTTVGLGPKTGRTANWALWSTCLSSAGGRCCRGGFRLGFCCRQECPLPRSEYWLCKTCSVSVWPPVVKPYRLPWWPLWGETAGLLRSAPKRWGSCRSTLGSPFSRCRNHKPRETVLVWCCATWGKGQCDRSVAVPLIFQMCLFSGSVVQGMLQTNSKILRFSQWCLVYRWVRAAFLVRGTTVRTSCVVGDITPGLF